MSVTWVTSGRIAPRVVERCLAAVLVDGRHDLEATQVATRCGRVWRDAVDVLGPASGVSAVWLRLVEPLAATLGWQPGAPESTTWGEVRLRIGDARLGPSRQAIVALPWGVEHDALHRVVTRMGVERGVRWIAACNGRTWRWYDAGRPHARALIEVDLEQAGVDGRVWQALWLAGRTARQGGLLPRDAGLAALAAAGVKDQSATSRHLRVGVSEALGTLARHADGTRDAHLQLVFQWLFLLFAEERSLVPAWHATHRRSYALGTLVREAAGGASPVGLQDSLTAIARLGRDGGRLGPLRCTALNGPLFDVTPPRRRGSSTRRTGDLGDAVWASTLDALTRSRDPGDGAIDYAHLDVEHLGAIYESVMDPVVDGQSGVLRKRTGAFYTPRVLADAIVERALGPLVREATADRILALRVLDPAMGSGALLASAHRFLVAAVQSAWMRDGKAGPLDVTPAERAALPRRVAEQCLFGVDVNARAVQVARLSLWLLSLADDRPLTWLDAHLVVGDSLVGVSPATILARPPTTTRRRVASPSAQLTLFDLAHWHHEADLVGAALELINARPTDTAADAREKSQALADLRARDGLATWRRRADAWCGAALDRPTPSAGLWRSIDEALRRGTRLDGHLLACHTRWQQLAASRRCVHWPLEFPDVFERPRGGFDAVIANPPWEMQRGDLGTVGARADAREDADRLLGFVRASGLYRDARGHVNSCQLFLERMLQLVRPGGRFGVLLPGSVLSDHGTSALRRHVFEASAIDRISILDNRDAYFPIHRSMRIVAMTGEVGTATSSLVVDEGVTATSGHVLTRDQLRLGSGEAEAIPRLRHADDLRVLDRLWSSPRLGDTAWALRFGRELNATEHRGLAASDRDDPGRLRLVDGKHLRAFEVHTAHATASVHADDARRVLPAAPWTRWRLGYRDVSSPTNTRSLLAALVPPGVVTTHTIFCLRDPPPLATQLYLLGMLNSLVSDWFVRRYLTSHVTAGLMARVPVPLPDRRHPRRRRVVGLAIRLMRSPDDLEAQAALHIEAAALHGLDASMLTTIAADFPRLPALVRQRLAAPIAATLRGS